MSQQRQIAAPRPNEARNELVALLNTMKPQIAAALPKHLTVERMVRMAVTLFSKSESLQKCSIQSIVACVVQASELGLELTGPLGHAFMVPYSGQATFQIGYKGFFELAFRSGKLSAWPMRVVFANDPFEVQYGSDQKIFHKPAKGERGDPIGYYSCLYMHDGGRDFDYLSVEDAEQHRDRYSKAYQGAEKYGKTNSPWHTNFDAMAMKTTVRSLAKRAPLSTELRAAASIDEYAEAGIGVDVMDITPSRSERVAGALNGSKTEQIQEQTEEQPQQEQAQQSEQKTDSATPAEKEPEKAQEKPAETEKPTAKETPKPSGSGKPRDKAPPRATPDQLAEILSERKRLDDMDDETFAAFLKQYDARKVTELFQAQAAMLIKEMKELSPGRQPGDEAE